MAILSNGKFYGYLCSVKDSGQKFANEVKIYVEDFVSGFAGHGWKLWETVAGFFRLEIDELVVRRTMTVFELMIHKIRAIIGAYAITQGNGKIKSAVLSADGTEYLIALEDKYMSLVEYDFIRCQEFDGGQKLYHVEIASISEGVIHVPVSEFEGSSVPEPGDEIIQFGNSSHDEKYAGRHSAIYMHADESGQPAIDVMFDIYSKDWTNCVKVRVGGDIPGTDGLKGFYCENGMIKCVDKNKHTTYCLHPDGTAELGDGAAIFRPDKSGHIAGGAIKWEWNEDRKKFVCTMGDVLLTWNDLDPETKKNLKEGILPGFAKDWDKVENQTEIDGEYVVSPKFFSGTKSADGKLTGIAQGKDCITIDGVKRTGIFALVDNEVVFELDPTTKRYLFRGKVETQSSGKKIIIDPDTNSIKMYDSNGIDVFRLLFIENNGNSDPQMSLDGNYRTDGENPSLVLNPNSIFMTDYTDYTSGTLKTTFSVSKSGIWFNRGAYGFKLHVDSKKTDISMGGGIYQRNLTRWNPGYLPHESQADSGDIYVNSDGILRLKP